MDLTFIKSPPVLRGPDSCRKSCKEILGKYRLSLGTELIRVSFLLKIESSWILVPSREDGFFSVCGVCASSLRTLRHRADTDDRDWKLRSCSASSLSPAVHTCMVQVAKARLVVALIGHWSTYQDPSRQGLSESVPLLCLFPSHQDVSGRGCSKIWRKRIY